LSRQRRTTTAGEPRRPRPEPDLVVSAVRYRERTLAVLLGLSSKSTGAVAVSIKRRDTNSRGVAYADGKPHWEVRLRRPDGRQYGKTFATRKAAEAWERGRLTAQATGGWVDPNAGKVPFRERAATYATDRPKALAPKTVELYGKQLDQLILPTFGAVPVSSITTE
jgi:hypothetical protein